MKLKILMNSTLLDFGRAALTAAPMVAACCMQSEFKLYWFYQSA